MKYGSPDFASVSFESVGFGSIGLAGRSAVVVASSFNSGCGCSRSSRRLFVELPT